MADDHDLGGGLRPLVEFGQRPEDRLVVGKIEAALDADFRRGAQGRPDGGQRLARAGCSRAKDQIEVQISRGKPFGHRVRRAMAPFVQRPVEIVQKRVFAGRFRVPEQKKSLGFQNLAIKCG